MESLNQEDKIRMLCREAEETKLQNVANDQKGDEHDEVRSQHQLIFRLRFWCFFRLDGAGLLERALYVFLLLDLFDFGAQFVRHSYRILTTIWICYLESRFTDYGWI